VAQKSLAFVVEAIGDDAAAAGGLSWYFGDPSLDGTIFLTYEWHGGLAKGHGLAEQPQNVDSTVAPFDVTIAASAFRFVLHGDQLAKRHWVPRPGVADSRLLVRATKSATVIRPGGAPVYTWGAGDDGTVIWVGDEAILLGTFGAGVFSGCIRGYYNTIAAYQPSGMHVYRQNPFRENRRCVVLEYNHDSGVLSQIWQGFVEDYSQSGPILEVDTVELLTAVQRGTLNRGTPKAIGGSFFSSIEYSPPAAAADSATGSFPMGPNQRVPKRVNKPNSASPHWVALQSGGAAFFARWQATDDAAGAGARKAETAYMIDNGSLSTSKGSAPRLGSTITVDRSNVFNAGAEGGTREILLVDRLGDEFFGISLGVAATRSSSRELKFPYHPLALVLALWTSGYDPEPGVPGSGAAGDFAFGETVTFLQTTQYFTNLTGVERVAVMRRVPDEDFIIAASSEVALDTILTVGNLTYTANNINRDTGSWVTDGVVKAHRPIIIGGTNPGIWTAAADPTAADLPIVETLAVAGPEAVTSLGVILTEGILAIPTDGGAHLNQWTNGGNNAAYSIGGGGIAVDENTGEVFAACRQNGNSVSITAKMPKTLLVSDWEQPDPGLNAAHHDIAVSADGTAGVYTTADNTPQAGLVRFDPFDGVVSSQGSGLDTTVAVAVEILEDDGATVVEVNTSDDIGGFTTDLDTADWVIDFAAGTATGTPNGAADAPTNTTEIGTNAQIMRDPTDSTVFWFCPGTGTNVETFLYKYNYLGAKLAEIDMIDHSSLITTSADDTPYACLDENGDLYVLVEDTATNSMDWVRFDPDGARRYSAVDDKGVSDIPDDSKSICVGGGGHVFIGNETPGEISVWSQT